MAGWACAAYEGDETVHPLGSPEKTYCGLTWTLEDVARAMGDLGQMKGIEPGDPRLCVMCLTEVEKVTTDG